MINHVRTLLGNRRQSSEPSPGDQYIDPTFAPATVVGSLREVRRVLFGHTPGDWMTNYRLQQFMPVLHSTALQAYVHSADPRCTYLAVDNTDFFARELYLTRTSNPESGIQLAGAGSPSDVSGRMLRNFRVSSEQGSPSLRIVDLQTNTELPPTDSNSQPLGDTGYFATRGKDVAASTTVAVVCRPRHTLSDVLQGLQSLPESTMVGLLGSGQSEPYTTFNNIWQSDESIEWRIGAILLAVAFRTEEAIQNGT